MRRCRSRSSQSCSTGRLCRSIDLSIRRDDHWACWQEVAMTVSSDPAATGQGNQTSMFDAFGMLSRATSQSFARATWRTLLVAGISSVILGILALAWTGPTLVVAGIFFGIYLLISGTFQLAGAFAPHVPTQLRVLGVISGALSVLLGLISFR